MKPGDMIEWTHKTSGVLVRKDETLWSSTEERFVPICNEMVHFLVSIDDKTYSWLNEKGLFHARVDDSAFGGQIKGGDGVVPRTRAK